MKSREDREYEIISESQARTLLDNLVKTNLVHRFSPYRGSVTYYSKTLTAQQIGEALVTRAERSIQNPKLKKLGERIRQAKQAKPPLCGDVVLCGDSSDKSPHNTDSPHNVASTTQPPPAHHPVATQSPHNASLNASLNASDNATPNAGNLFVDLKIGIEAKPNHYPDGGEPALAEVKSLMEDKVEGAGDYAASWLRAMQKRGWVDNFGHPVINWKPLAVEFANNFKK